MTPGPLQTMGQQFNRRSWAEPWKIKVVEFINLLPRGKRLRSIKRAGYNTFLLESRDVYIDSNQLEHILLNVLGNARKYSQGQGDVLFQIIFDEEYVEFIVKDKGIGMSKEDLDNLFQPFYRGKNTEGIQGTGLGMSIIHEYIKMNNGKISVISEVNKGTTVRMTFDYK